MKDLEDTSYSTHLYLYSIYYKSYVDYEKEILKNEMEKVIPITSFSFSAFFLHNFVFMVTISGFFGDLRRHWGKGGDDILPVTTTFYCPLISGTLVV